jgi:tetratricopeptide (TPR) repeat protein
VTALLIAVVATCFALRVIAAFVSSNWSWGLDTLRDWPRPAGAALAAIAALGFIPAVADRLERALTRLGEMWQRSGIPADVVAALAVAVVLFFLRDPVRFVGDFDLRVGTLATALAPSRMFPQAFPLDLLANVSLARTLMQLGLAPPVAMQAVGSAMAFAFIVAGLAFARAAGARGASLPAAALLLLGGGWLVHFAGYDKFGPLMVGWTLAAAGAVRLARQGTGAWLLAAGAAICLLSHRAGYVAMPAVAAAYVLAWRSAPPAGRAPLAIGAAAVAGVALAMAARTWSLITSVDVAAHLAPAGAPAGQSQGLLRVTDALNVLFFLLPLWPAGLLAAGYARAPRAAGVRAGRFSLAPVAALALAAQAVFLIGTRAGQGDARDWDIFTATALAFGLVGAYGFIRLWARGSRPAALAPVVTITLATAVALWGVNVSRTLQLARAEARLAAQPAWRDSQRAQAHDFLGLYAFNEARYDAAARHFEQAIEAAPNPRFFYQAALAHLRAGHIPAARDAAMQAARRAPDKGDPWWILARAASLSGDSARAAACLDSARVRGSTRPPAGL